MFYTIGHRLERPARNKHSSLLRSNVNYRSKRFYNIGPRMGYRAGYEEDSFLRELNVKPEEFEFLAENCTKVIFSHFSRQN
jgi:hypothetical protein